MANLATYTVKQLSSGNSYDTTPDGSYVNFKANEPTEGVFYFTPEMAKNVFSAEDDIELRIDIGGGATKVFRGFVDDKGMSIKPGDVREVYVHAVDWGFYLAAKEAFEKQYWRTSDAKTVFTDSAARVSDGTTTLSSSQVSAALTTAVKREFFATQIKDAWMQAGLDGGADYFVDTSVATPTLNAFAHDAKSLQTGGANYKIVDYSPSLSKEMMRDPNFEWNYFGNVAQKFRSVTVTNGIAETLPQGDINDAMSKIYKDDINGKSFHQLFTLGTASEYDISTTATLPVDILQGDNALNVAGAKFVIAKFNWASAATSSIITFKPRNLSGTPFDMNITKGDYQEIRFFIKNDLATAAVGSITIRLNDNATLGSYTKSILSHLNGTSWSFLKYDLPTASSANGWTLSGTVNEFDSIDLEFRTSGGSLIGFTGSVSLAWFHLFTRQRATVTGAGNPPTLKLMVDKSVKDAATLANLATAEQARVNAISPRAFAVCDSNLAFIKPAYRVDLDFTNTLESDATGTLRMAEIKHFLWRGYSKMALTFNRPYARV